MNYEINEGTIAIVPINEERSKVYEDDLEYLIENKAFNIMENSCRYYGSSYRGRKEGSKTLLGAEYKVPIIIEDSRNIVFFPTISPKEETCSWIAVKKVKNIEKIDDISSKIVFLNDKTIEIPISYRSLENQLYRAARLESIIRNRKK